MGKVKLTKEQAACLEADLESFEGDRIRTLLAYNEHAMTPIHPLLNVDLNTIASALYIGYEVEPTPEEKVLEIYEWAENERHQDGYDEYMKGYYVGYKDGIKDALEALKIEIKGIND